jgi:hypothetical protein
MKQDQIQTAIQQAQDYNQQEHQRYTSALQQGNHYTPQYKDYSYFMPKL